MSKILTEEDRKLVIDVLRIIKGLETKLKEVLGQK